MRARLLAWVWCLGLAPMLLGQENPSSAPTYLLRLERMEALSDVCVLVRSDGPYHLEKNDGDKVDVYEGNLPEGDVQKLQRWVSANELFTLTQDKIIAPVFSSGKDELVVAVHRPGYWQNLDFPAPSTWQPLHQSVAPLAQWFDELLKAKHRVKLKEEEARSNCIPHHELKFSTREPAPAAPPKPDFLFILHDTTIENQFGKKVCTIVYRDGQFHRETKAQKMGSTDITTATYDGKLDPADVTQLQAILEKPGLQNRRTPLLPSGGYMKEGEIVSVTTPGEAKPRTVLFWKYVPAGLVSGKIYDENGMKDLAPLAQWLKTAVDSQKERPTPNGSLTDCVPMVQPSARSH